MRYVPLRAERTSGTIRMINGGIRTINGKSRCLPYELKRDGTHCIPGVSVSEATVWVLNDNAGVRLVT